MSRQKLQRRKAGGRLGGRGSSGHGSASVGPLAQLALAAEFSPDHAKSAQMQTRAASRAGAYPAPPVPVIQRAAVIPYETWKSRSSKAGLKRSDALLRIDEALILYQASVFKDIGTQKTRLTTLKTRITAWKTAKDQKYAGKSRTSRRMKDVEALEQQVRAKEQELDQIPTEHPEFGQRTHFTFDVYNRIRLRVQQLLAVPPKQIEAQTRRNMVAGLAELRGQVRDMDEYSDPVTAIWDACSILIAIGEKRLNVAVAARRKTNRHIKDPLPRYKTRYKRHYKRAEEQIEAQNQQGFEVAPHVIEALQKTRSDVDMYLALAGQSSDTDTDIDLPEGFNEAIDLSAEAMNALGMQGTGGKGNEGLEDYWKTTIPDSDSDQKKQAKEMAATIMGGLHSAIGDDQATKDKLSGGADIGASAVMGVKLSAEIARLFAIVSKCNAVLKTDPNNKDAKSERKKAILQLTMLSTVGTVEVLGKYLGGAFTAAKGDGHVIDSNMFSSNSTDVSTDMKLTGDAAGVVLNGVRSVQSVVDMCKNIFKRAKPVKNDKKSVGEHVQDAFDSVHDISGAASAVGSAYSGVRKLYEQIAAGGQVASENVGSVTDVVRGTVNNVPIIPVLGLIKGCMDFVAEGIKLARTGHAAYKAKAVGKQFIATGTESLYLAFMVTRDKFIKQIKRAIIDLIHAAAAVTSGALNVSGLGAGIGAAIGMVSTTAKLVQIGIRKFKQHRRDKAAGKETNLEKAAMTANGEEFVNYALVRTQVRLGGRKKRGFDKDKSTANKEFRYNFVAMEIMRAPEAERKWFFDALNIRRDAQRIANKTDPAYNKELALKALIIKSLKER